MDRQFFSGAVGNHFLRGGLAVVGDRILFSRPSDVMNLFCVGISHHTAKVETRAVLAEGTAGIVAYGLWLRRGGDAGDVQSRRTLCGSA
jgi:hypothetical protein